MLWRLLAATRGSAGRGRWPSSRDRLSKIETIVVAVVAVGISFAFLYVPRCFTMFSRSWNISSFLLLLLLRGVSRLPWQIASVMWWKEHRRPNVRLSGGPTLSRFSSSSSIYPSIHAISWGKASFPLDQNRFSKPPFSSSRSMFVFDAKGHDPGSLQTLCQTFRPFDCSGLFVNQNACWSPFWLCLQTGTWGILRESRQAPSDSTILQLSSAAHGNMHRIHTQLYICHGYISLWLALVFWGLCTIGSC